jgi:deoxyribonuclease V
MSVRVEPATHLQRGGPHSLEVLRRPLPGQSGLLHLDSRVTSARAQPESALAQRGRWAMPKRSRWRPTLPCAQRVRGQRRHPGALRGAGSRHRACHARTRDLTTSPPVTPHWSWPTSAPELRRLQQQLGAERPPPWHPPVNAYTIGGCFVCFARARQARGGRVDGASADLRDHAATAGARGDAAWAGAALACYGRNLATAVVAGSAGHPYEPGLLALREGPLLDAAVRALPEAPVVLLVNATGRDHPRRAGLALHLGAVLGLPSVGVTHRPLLAHGAWPPAEVGAHSQLLLGGEPVACWLRTRRGARPLVVHPAWRTDLETARATVIAALGRFRAPEPLREARRAARRARAAG